MLVSCNVMPIKPIRLEKNFKDIFRESMGEIMY